MPAVGQTPGLQATPRSPIQVVVALIPTKGPAGEQTDPTQRCAEVDAAWTSCQSGSHSTPEFSRKSSRRRRLPRTRGPPTKHFTLVSSTRHSSAETSGRSPHRVRTSGCPSRRSSQSPHPGRWQMLSGHRRPVLAGRSEPLQQQSCVSIRALHAKNSPAPQRSPEPPAGPIRWPAGFPRRSAYTPDPPRLRSATCRHPLACVPTRRTEDRRGPAEPREDRT